MTDDNETTKPVSDKALELVMRDVLDAMMEFSLASAYADRSIDFEILEVAPSNRAQNPVQRTDPAAHRHAKQAQVITFPLLTKAAG